MSKLYKCVITFIISLLALLAGAILFPQNAVMANAQALSTVTGLRQIDSASDSVGFIFGKVSSVDGYDIEVSKDNIKWTHMKSIPSDKTINSGLQQIRASVNGLDDGTTYYVRMRAYTCDTIMGQVNGSWSAAVKMVTTPSQAVTGLKQTDATVDSATLTWDAVPGATGYYIEYYIEYHRDFWDEYFPSAVKYNDETGNLIVNKTKATFSLKKDTSHEYTCALYITPIRQGDSFTAYGSSETYLDGVKFLPKKLVEISSCQKNTKKMLVNWSKRRSADGYQYQIYNTKTGQKITAKSTTKSYVEVKTPKRNFYKIKVRPYMYINGKIKYGEYSGWQYFSQDVVPTLKRTTSGIKVNWKKIEGATDYTVYVTTKATTNKRRNTYEETYEEVGTVKNNSLTINKYKKSALKKNTTYYFYVVANKKVGKSMFSSNPDSLRSIVYK